MHKQNHSQLALVIADHNPLITLVFVQDHQIVENQKNTHKTDREDQIIQTISTETTIPDQTPIEVTSLIIKEIVHIQIPEIVTTLTIDQEFLK